MSEAPVKRVSDVAPQGPEFRGTQVKVRQLVDKEFIIHQIVELSGEGGPYLGVQIEGSGKPFFFFTHHKVVMRKLKACVGSEPLLATIRKRDPKNGGNAYFDIE